MKKSLKERCCESLPITAGGIARWENQLIFLFSLENHENQLVDNIIFISMGTQQSSSYIIIV